MLTIIVTGRNKSGRSTLAKHMQEYLKEKGMDVRIKDEKLTLEWQKENEERMNSMCEEGTPVEIKVI
jgi:tRNA uridine 5-carbamoylmethylation protein Kti12